MRAKKGKYTLNKYSKEKHQRFDKNKKYISKALLPPPKMKYMNKTYKPPRNKTDYRYYKDDQKWVSKQTQ